MNMKKEKINMKSQSLIPILILIACLGLLPKAQAVNPPPDGGYPGGNTAEGASALLSLTSGTFNTAVGLFSVISLTDGNFCTGVGAGTLLSNTADQNTATGAGALFSNTTGFQNTANGTFALFSNTAGNFNTATGDRALLNNTEGSSNTANGVGSLHNNTTGNSNTAIGVSALVANTIGSANTATGVDALAFNTIGADNTASGFSALSSNTEGSFNTASGDSALFSNTVGSKNTAVGFQALFNNLNNDNNTAVGFGALFNQTFANGNTAIGRAALAQNISGANNTALGNLAGSDVTTATNVICIGADVAGANVDFTCFIGNIRDVQTQNADAIPVLVDSAGQLGTASSSRRFKKEIKPMESASETILALKPVTFHYKSDETSTPQFGLIAEEVAEVNPDLVVRDKDGEVYTVRYDAVNAMLLNEFLKEHRKVEEQEAIIAELRSTVAKAEANIVCQRTGMEALIARLNEQAAQIQKVSAQIELNRPAPQQVDLKIP